MPTFRVNLPQERSYLVHTGSEILFPVKNWYDKVLAKNALLLYDTRLKKTALKLSVELKKLGCQTFCYPFKASEEAKNFDSVSRLHQRMCKAGLDRQSVVFALGGGVVGDVAGFAAGTYLRGIAWIGIPTTLVAQVDSCVGGKTGINMPMGKNLVGIIHQPSLVICDCRLLETLGEKDIISGLGEMIKYGLVFSPKLLHSIEKHWKDYLRLDPKYMPKAIAECLKLKGKIVEQDEMDKTGLRQKLNFGHTFGHAFESATGYKTFRHGEAVLLGIRIACELSVLKSHLKRETQQAIDTFLQKIPITTKTQVSLKTLLANTKLDKKLKGGKIGFVLLEDLGKTVIDYSVTKEEIKKAIKNLALPQVSI